MATIEIDFDVYKELTALRKSEDHTYNDVLRELLGLPGREKKRSTDQRNNRRVDWVIKGVRFPNGTEFRARYKGKLYYAKVEESSLMMNGKRYDSPSSAAGAITNTFVNGWVFWECRFPGDNQWRIIKSLRNERSI